ncbi:uncharacterized protein LTR77_002501 [Saxophila tyrrhenica]|uniref:BAG domain-containing protein n=1 Tax=Saxophila tyrrhenica TaxID=1690608 RepID=A0AAV9PM71_9PEZI|nr:hypothetical protein LTR77_002501 [Saxophila tyrrhenica]
MPTVASSSFLQAISSTSRSLLGESRADNLSAAFSQAGKAIESFLLPQTTTTQEAPKSWQTQTYDTINDFIASRSSLENTSLLLALCTFLFLLVRNMSWTSRLGNLGRFSPFTRSPTQSGSAKVSDSDFSYITADDLRRHQQESITGQAQSGSPPDYGPQRDTDVLVLRNKKRDFHMHFAAYSIAKGELSVGQVRDAAAKKMNTAPSQIKLLYRGKNLKDDARTCKQEGLRDGADIMCTVSEGLQDGDGSSSGEEEDDGVEGQANGDGTKKKRRKPRKSKKKIRREEREAGASGTGTSTPERLGVPPSSQPSTRPVSPKPPTPATPVDKLNALHSTLMTFDQDVQNFLKHPPPEQAKKEYEHKRLSETILTQVLLKLDAVETEGDADARVKRKELVKETQGILTSLDSAMKQ